MSLFSSLGNGDIWSISGINFASPVNDILDKESFTLEELLQEDDLLQEVKSKDERLLAFLQSEETVQKLVEYVVITADEDAEDFRKFKYPYMKVVMENI
jgi:serine/threonine-protein phosphatase 6 regulatory subunit 3